MVDQGILSILIIVLLGVCGWVFIIWKNARATHEQIRDIVQQQNMVRTDMSARDLCHAVHLIHPAAHIGIDYIIGHDSAGQDATWRNGMPMLPSRRPKSCMTPWPNSLKAVCSAIMPPCAGPNTPLSVISWTPPTRRARVM